MIKKLDKFLYICCLDFVFSNIEYYLLFVFCYLVLLFKICSTLWTDTNYYL